MSALFEFVVFALAVWFVVRFVAKMAGWRSEPAEPGAGRDDSVGVPAWLRPQPKSGAGAVALAEPDEDDEEFTCQAISTRRTDGTSMQMS